MATHGTVLEAAFVDPAYSWPPAEGAGKYAIELTASSNLTNKRKKRTVTTVKQKKKGLFGCCGSSEDVVTTAYSHENSNNKADKYACVPEGILIYELNTLSHEVTLKSGPSSNTDVENLFRGMTVTAASSSSDLHRRGILLTGKDGSRATLVACEQRTAINWLEAIQRMLKRKPLKKISKQQGADEAEYLNLAAYSNKMINKESKEKGGGIYYSVEAQTLEGETYDEETLESIAKRRSVIKDSWDFFRMVCSLLRDKNKYDEVSEKLQLDPVYPYLNSMTGLADPGDNGYENFKKQVVQKRQPQYDNMTDAQICKDLVKRAEEALPSLVEICKALAGSLGMEEVGVGPIKEYTSALKKAELKYNKDVLKVTDYCRALLVVKDLPTLLALLELARDNFGPIIRRVKLSSLKKKNKPLIGGYRDCKINLELKGHICEIQIHLWPMWTVCGVDGYRHYRHSAEYSTDTFDEPFDALAGLDQKTRAELIVMAEEAVAAMPIERLEWFHEKFILDYFAESGIMISHGLYTWAETTLRQLVRLRSASPDIGIEHHETLQLQKYLERALRAQNKITEADEIKAVLDKNARVKQKAQDDAEESLWSYLVDPVEMFESILDPNKKEREEEEKNKQEIKASKKAWKKIRKERFGFLDKASNGNSGARADDDDESHALQ